jgi:hypothetical protein
MTAPYSIEIFVPNGDPEGLRIVSLKNWTGVGLVFPRETWSQTRKREEFGWTGVYLLSGYGEDDPDFPVIYIGQTDELRKRINQHEKGKDFWDRCVVFVSSNNFLNRAHVTWLEWALYYRASKIGQCKINNSQVPQKSSLSESDEADMEAFLSQMMQVFPLIGVRVFEQPRVTKATADQPSGMALATAKSVDSKGRDTIIVPANQEGFEDVFLGQNCWHAIRIGGGMRDRIKYIAGYQTKPISAVTHLANVDHIESYGDTGKYKVVFAEPAKEFGPVPYGNAPRGAMQGPRYTRLELLQKASSLADIL